MASPPSWLASLADRIAAEMCPVDIPAPVGCHYYYSQELDQWETSLFTARTETVGGERDGTISLSRFNVDLSRVMEVFDEIHELQWQALSLGQEDEVGPHISIEGTFEGNNVWVRILAMPPERFNIGRYFKVYDMRLEDIW